MRIGDKQHNHWVDVEKWLPVGDWRTVETAIYDAKDRFLQRYELSAHDAYISLEESKALRTHRDFIPANDPAIIDLGIPGAFNQKRNCLGYLEGCQLFLYLNL